jgi:hypothetical protein
MRFGVRNMVMRSPVVAVEAQRSYSRVQSGLANYDAITQTGWSTIASGLI